MIINAFGFLLDWLMTRHWQRIFLLLIVPATLIVVVLTASIWGSLLDKDVLAAKYLEIGERELRDADQDWAFDLTALGTDKKNAQEISGGGPDSLNQISRFTTAVFQRSQQLQHNNLRTRFVIGAILGQQGAIANALAAMKQIAPDDRPGYLPAHCWIANLMLTQKPFPKEQLPLLRHHLALGSKWEAAPASLLIAGAQLALQDQDQSAAIDLLRKSAEKQPEFEADLFRLAIQLGNTQAARQTADKSLPRLLNLVKDGTATAADRIALADILFYQKDYDAARGAIEEGLKVPNLSEADSRILRRGLSDFYRLQFIQSLKVSADSWSADLRLLDQAMRIDPSNPMVAEEVAKLARLGGDKPSDELLQRLNEFLAQGTATPVTHAWIAEAYILRSEFDKAIDHLTTVVDRIPDSGQSHNNLAYAIALSKPERLEEALVHARTAVANDPRNADFRDTLGFVLLKLERTREALTEIEIAIELSPQRADLHQRAVEVYRLLGDEQTARAHQKIVERLNAPAESQGN